MFESKRLQNLKILIVDDEEMLRETLSELFTEFGANVTLAENGIVAYELIKKSAFDAIISDVRMPGGDGVELVKRVAAEITPIPKMFLCSGYIEAELEDEAPKAALEVFQKPFKVIEMVESVAAHFGRGPSGPA